LPPQGRCGFQT